MKFFVILFLILVATGCNESVEKELAFSEPDPISNISEEKKAYKEEIIEEDLRGCANKYPLYSQERQKGLDDGSV